MNGSAVYSRLSGDGTITAIAGNRIYPEYIMEADKVYPLACYKVEQVAADIAYDGPTGLMTCQLVIAAIGQQRQDAETLSNAILTSLDGSTAQWGATTYVQGCFLAADGINDDVVTQQDSEDVIFYVKELTFDCSYNFTSA